MIGNWKMHKVASEAVSFVEELIPALSKTEFSVGLAVPFTAIEPLSRLGKGLIAVGAQNMHDELEGAFTGEISASMLLDAGAEFVILGHSERRILFGEDNPLINRKVKRALTSGLKALLCIGETQAERREGRGKAVVKEQIERGLEGISNPTDLVLAYEPVWAIGSGCAAEPGLVEEMHLFCRACLKELFGSQAAREIPLIYGGSVAESNAGELLDREEVEGLLVGKSSLSAERFGALLEIYQHQKRG